MQKLKKKWIGSHLLEVVSSMYRRSQSAVRHNGKLGEVFPVERVAQGCILSPLLFAIDLDDFLISLRKERFGNEIFARGENLRICESKRER
jgi:hypothetical protein